MRYADPRSQRSEARSQRSGGCCGRRPGQRREADTGLYDYRARYYDPAIGRFIQPDSIVPEPGNPQGLNRYAYVDNNPLRYTDPTGHYIILEGEPSTRTEFAVRETPEGAVVLHGGTRFPTAEHVAVANYVLTEDTRYLHRIPEQTGPWGPSILVDVFTALGYQYRNWRGEVWGEIGPVLLGVGMEAVKGEEEYWDGYRGVREASAYLQQEGVPRGYRKQIIESFEIETIRVRTAGTNEYGIRYYDEINASARGRYLFRTFPASRESLAIEPEWNQMTKFRAWRIRPGTVIIEGRAAAQGPYYSGGQWQMFILHPEEALLP